LHGYILSSITAKLSLKEYKRNDEPDKEILTA